MVPGKTMSIASVFYVSHWGEETVTIIATKVSPHSRLWKSSSFQIFPKRCVTYTGMCQVRLNIFQIQAQKCFCLLSWTKVQKISKWLPLQRNPFLQKFLSFIQGEFVWKCSRDSISLCSQSGPFSPKLVHFLCMISLHLDSVIPPAHGKTFNPFYK